MSYQAYGQQPYYQQQNNYHQQSNYYQSSPQGNYGYQNNNSQNRYNQNYQPNRGNIYQRSNSNSSQGSQNNYSSLQKYARINFIRKVYFILTLQMIVTTIMIWLAMEVPEYAKFQRRNPAIFYFLIFLSIAVSLAMLCVSKLTKEVPTNYILLFTFTFCEGYIVSYICQFAPPIIVFQAAILTAGVTLGLTVYALVTEKDFTLMGAGLFMFLFAIIIIGLLNFFIRSPALHLLYLFLGVICYGLYLIYDTQLLTGNKRNSLDLDDYILGAMMIYQDIILIFLKLLEILNILNGDGNDKKKK